MKSILILSILLFSCPATGQFPFSAALKAAIDAEMFPQERGKKPGYIVTIVQNDSVVYNRATGYINVAKEIPFTADSRIAIASLSKQFTALGLHLLLQEGKISLSDDVHKYIPELPKYPRPMLIRHLLSHTSGIRDHITILGWENNQQSHFYDFQGTVDALKKYCWTSFPSGEDFAYSNTGYILLALIIERVSGQEFENYMKERVFDPLHMEHTEFSFKRKGEEYGHSTAYDYNTRRKHFRIFKLRESNALGATGIYTTVNDLLKWDQNFTTATVGGTELLQYMQQSDTLDNGRSVHYHNGIKHRHLEGFEISEHSGGWAHYNVQYIRVPELGLSIVISANNEFDYPIEMGERLLKLLLPEKIKELPGPPATVENCALRNGLYLADNMSLREIVTIDGAMFVKISGSHKDSLIPLYYSEEQRRVMDEEGFAVHIGNASFEWSGGAYFNTPHTFYLLESDSSFNYPATAGRYMNCEMGSVRLKYKKMSDRYVMIGSLIKRVRLDKVYDKLYEAKKHDFKLLFIDPYTYLLGNNRVFDLEFKRILD